MAKSLEERVAEAVREEVSIVPYDQEWPRLFEREAADLRRKLPGSIVKRVEHFGSTAVPGLAAKPIIDVLVEVSSLAETCETIVPLLTAEGGTLASTMLTLIVIPLLYDVWQRRLSRRSEKA